MARPDLDSTPVFFHNYINQVVGDDLMKAFKKESPALFQFLESIPAEKYDYRYAEGKWSIRELIQHMIDAERIFAYRALRFARKDATPLAGFDENSYTDNSKADKRSWQELIEEFKTVRKASEYLFGSFDDEQLNAKGISSNNSISVLAFGYIVIGHPLHHVNIITHRYLV
ncbi:MAG: DinB family protein [Chitinophagaceae bacterium]